MKFTAIIQGRMGSERFPGKVLMNVDDKYPIIHYVISQLKYCKNLDNIIFATTTLPEDDKIEEFLIKMNIPCFRGSSEDVLDRYYKCAKKFSISHIVRITSDDPLIDPNIVDDVIDVYKSNSYDYVTNAYPRSFPYGTETEIFSFKALELAWKESELPEDREHVTLFFNHNQDRFKVFSVRYKENISHLSWTVDEKKDLEFVRYLVSKIKKRPILMEDILKVINPTTS